VVADGAFDLVIFEAGFVAVGRVLRLVCPVWGFGVARFVVDVGWFWPSCHFVPFAPPTLGRLLSRRLLSPNIKTTKGSIFL